MSLNWPVPMIVSGNLVVAGTIYLIPAPPRATQYGSALYLYYLANRTTSKCIWWNSCRVLYTLEGINWSTATFKGRHPEYYKVTPLGRWYLANVTRSRCVILVIDILLWLPTGSTVAEPLVRQLVPFFLYRAMLETIAATAERVITPGSTAVPEKG